MGFHEINSRPWKELLPGVRMRSFWGDEMLVCHIEIAPGAVAPLHRHIHEQSGTVISGEIEFTIAGETRILKTGDSYLIPSNVEHKAVGIKNAKLFEIFSPVREEYKY
ncbi:MAG: cupin domain-containing protein [Chloroflexi bacterium]|nr:cupin domain-containing protein [Chloroflexota bacterium]